MSTFKATPALRSSLLSLLLVSCATTPRPVDQVSGPIPTDFKHQYKAGESWEYFFEDSEGTFLTKSVDGLPRADMPMKFEEMQIRLRITILGVEAGVPKKRVELLEVSFRELKPEQIQTGETVPLVPVQSLIPGFPKPFAYEFAVDEGRIVEELHRYFEPYLENPVGLFLYYKLLDVHTFQGTMDHLPPEAPGHVGIGASRDIPLKDGVFHNHAPVRLLQRIDRLGGTRQAFYKVMTLGNHYAPTMLPKPMDTNYRFTFHVPVEGPNRGIIYDGDLQEEITLRHAPIIIQRQLSITLQTPERRTGI